MQIGNGKPRRARLLDCRFGIVPGMNLGSTKAQSLDQRRAGARQTEDRGFLALE